MTSSLAYFCFVGYVLSNWNFYYWLSKSKVKKATITKFPLIRVAPNFLRTLLVFSLHNQQKKSKGNYKRKYLAFSNNIWLFSSTRAWYYCKACHEDIKDENLIKKCKCKNCKYFLHHLDMIFPLVFQITTITIFYK